MHLLAILAALVGSILLGFGFAILAWGVQLVSEDVASLVAVIGFVFVFSVVFSWVGHLPGAVVLHMALVRGRGGWAVAMAGGLAIGLVLSVVIGGGIAVVMAPLLAVIHLLMLRWLAGVFRRRKARIVQAVPGGSD